LPLFRRSLYLVGSMPEQRWQRIPRVQALVVGHQNGQCLAFSDLVPRDRIVVPRREGPWSAPIRTAPGHRPLCARRAIPSRQFRKLASLRRAGAKQAGTPPKNAPKTAAVRWRGAGRGPCSPRSRNHCRGRASFAPRPGPMFRLAVQTTMSNWSGSAEAVHTFETQFPCADRRISSGTNAPDLIGRVRTGFTADRDRTTAARGRVRNLAHQHRSLKGRDVRPRQHRRQSAPVRRRVPPPAIAPPHGSGDQRKTRWNAQGVKVGLVSDYVDRKILKGLEVRRRSSWRSREAVWHDATRIR